MSAPNSPYKPRNVETSICPPKAITGKINGKDGDIECRKGDNYMPRYNVQNDKGEWACFSSICDGFITDFMPRDKYQAWRERQYGVNCGKIEEANIMDYHEAMQTTLCREASNKGYDLQDLPEFSCPCDYCKFQNKETKKCEIVERQNEVERDGYDH